MSLLCIDNLDKFNKYLRYGVGEGNFLNSIVESFDELPFIIIVINGSEEPKAIHDALLSCNRLECYNGSVFSESLVSNDPDYNGSFEYFGDSEIVTLDGVEYKFDGAIIQSSDGSGVYFLSDNLEAIINFVKHTKTWI